MRPKKFGKWNVVRTLRPGGEADTYIVVEEGVKPEKKFVLKAFRRNRSKRIRNEVRACRELSHPNILRVVEDDQEHSPPYLVSEYCNGQSLDKVDILGYPLIERLRMFLVVCRAVGYAHSHDPTITHRDLKPANIFLLADKRTPVVGDWGVCFIADDREDRDTRTNEVVMTRWYGCPELGHGRAEEVTPRCDVYSLGKVLYWMLAARVFDRESHREKPFDLIEVQNTSEYYFIYDLLDRMIRKEPSERLSNANEVADNVDELITKILMKAHPLDLAAPQQCLYCGVGMYKKRVETDLSNSDVAGNALRSSGFNFINSQRWLILICDNCGNSQIFVRTFPTTNKWKT